ncbi:MAG TPA: hypothetical protein VHY32_11575 [Caulobacteraceae bacterium]|jgi:hypothetical protein|nr:hypothetical protein [Caulobacteraceae bacterium]
MEAPDAWSLGLKFDDVSNARMHDVVLEEVERVLVPLGFRTVGVLKWVRDKDAPVRQLFGFQKWKGGKVSPRWGVSCDFVPHLSGNEVHWHRSSPKARFDMAFTTQDRELEMLYRYGDRPIRMDLPGVLMAVMPRAVEFWAMLGPLGRLRASMERMRRQYPQSGYPFPGYREDLLTGPFILAGAGSLEIAQAELDQALSRWPCPEKTRGRLVKLLIEASESETLASMRSPEARAFEEKARREAPRPPLGVMAKLAHRLHRIIDPPSRPPKWPPDGKG